MSLFARRLLGGSVLLALFALATQAMAESIPQYATVTFVKGSARYSSDNKTWHALKKGDVLAPGCLIQTADKSIVDILLGDKGASGGGGPSQISTGKPSASGGGGGGGGGGLKSNIVRIMENSYLGIDKLLVENTGTDMMAETQLDLRAGQIMGNVKKLSASSKYEIKIPNGVAGIRGTTYLISSSGVVEVLSGSVLIVIVAADGTMNQYVVTAGNSFDPSTGLITPIPPATLSQLQKIYQELHGATPTPPTTIPKDHTIIYVSPN